MLPVREIVNALSGKNALNIDADIWSGFEVAHIFPLAYQDHWNRHGYSRWISLPPENGGSINSAEWDGLMLIEQP